MRCPESAPEQRISFVIAMNDRKVFENNFLTSRCLSEGHANEIIVQQHFTSASKAYNNALDKSSHDLVVFCHQDVHLPEAWLTDLWQAIKYLATHDPNWGVLGCSGMTADRRHWRYLY